MHESLIQMPVLPQTRSLYAVYKHIMPNCCIVIMNNLSCMVKMRVWRDCSVTAAVWWECAVLWDACGNVCHFRNGGRVCEKALDMTGWPWMIYIFSSPPLSSHPLSIHPSLKSSGCKSPALSVLPYLTVLSSLSLSLSLSPCVCVCWSFLDSGWVFGDGQLAPDTSGSETYSYCNSCLTSNPKNISAHAQQLQARGEECFDS